MKKSEADELIRYIGHTLDEGHKRDIVINLIEAKIDNPPVKKTYTPVFLIVIGMCLFPLIWYMIAASIIVAVNGGGGLCLAFLLSGGALMITGFKYADTMNDEIKSYNYRHF